MIYEKVRVIHIHTDYKFIHNSNFFEGDFFDNRIIIIQNHDPYTGPFKDKARLFSTKSKDLNEIINICKDADLVVLYDLNLIKSLIALALPKNIKIAWRFFGYELYSKRKDLFVSEKSAQYAIQNLQSTPQQLLKPVRKIYHLLKYGGTPDNLFYKAIIRINYMLTLSNEEYEFLKNYWPLLPEFVKLPHRYYESDIKLPDFQLKTSQEKPIIVLGNNGSVYNNHLDLIELIDRNPNKNNYNFTLLFNYAYKKEYAKAVKHAINGKPYYTLIEDFIPPEKFEAFYQSISALVINGYRQMAGANIFMALQNGAKVYLNEKNVFLQWLRNEGFKVFTIEDFERDLKEGNVQLDYKIAAENLEQLKVFSKRYTKEDFQKTIYT